MTATPTKTLPVGRIDEALAPAPTRTLNLVLSDASPVLRSFARLAKNLHLFGRPLAPTRDLDRWRTSCKRLNREPPFPMLTWAVAVMNQIMRQAKKSLSDRRGALLRVWHRTAGQEQQFSGAVEKDWTDVAADPEAAAVLHALSEKERRELEEIEAALARLADGTYGLCQSCGRAIGRQRLLAIPEARFCLECSGSP